MIPGADCGGEGVVGLGVAGIGAVDVGVEAEGEEVGFHGSDAVEAPGSVGDGLSEVGFGGALGLVLEVEGLGVLLVGGEVVGGQDDDLAGEAVAEGVHGGTLFAGGGFGAGGFGGVGAVDGAAVFVHGVHLGTRNSRGAGGGERGGWVSG